MICFVFEGHSVFFAIKFLQFVLQMVKLLLNKGSNLSAIDKKERQPIHCAAYLGKQVLLFLPNSTYRNDDKCRPGLLIC